MLDNIVLIQETLDWAKVSKQPLLWLKLDFAKAYDRVLWVFLFQIMEALGFDQTFISMVKLLFNRASASIYINGAPPKRFQIGAPPKRFQINRGVCQGCPLAPYLFLLIGEVLNIQMKEAGQKREELKVLSFPQSLSSK
jgi:hypothetical protein